MRHLAEGNTIRVLTRRKPNMAKFPNKVEVYYGDLTSDSLELVSFVDGVDLLYHCAAELKDASRMYSVHVQGTTNLLKAAVGRIGRWIQLSSVGVYGPHLSGVVTEETPLNPTGSYEKTKAESDCILLEAALNGAVKLSILRPSIVFGEDMANRSLFQLVSTIYKDFFFFIGKPGASANYIYIDNVVEALVLCGHHPRAEGRVYNLSDRRTMEEFTSIIARNLEKSVPRLRVPENLVRTVASLCGILPKFPLKKSRIDALTNRCIYNTDRIEKELGYRHTVSMEEGLARLVRHWKNTRKGMLT